MPKVTYTKITEVESEITEEIKFPIYARYDEERTDVFCRVCKYNEDGTGVQFVAYNNMRAICVHTFEDWNNESFFKIREHKTTKGQFEYWKKQVRKSMKR